MTYVAATADKLSSGRSISLSGKTALVIAAIAFASGASAWIAGIDPIAWVSNSPSNRPIDAPTFEARLGSYQVLNLICFRGTSHHIESLNLCLGASK
jgi:hypothetical protein